MIFVAKEMKMVKNTTSKPKDLGVNNHLKFQKNNKLKFKIEKLDSIPT